MYIITGHFNYFTDKLNLMYCNKHIIVLITKPITTRRLSKNLFPQFQPGAGSEMKPLT
jgi:hypothetical protein